MDEPQTSQAQQKSQPSEAEWRAHCEAWEQSKLPQKRYCQTHHLSYPRFVLWRSKILREQGMARTSKPNTFLPVRCQPPRVLDTPHAHTLKVQLPNGVTLNASNNISDALLAKALGLLGIKSC